MATFKFKVTETDVKEFVVTVEAKTFTEAEEKINDDLNGKAVVDRETVYSDATTEIQPIPEIRDVESLFNPDKEENIEVILVSELSHEQKAFLRIKE
jgi:hypothetical protein